MPTTSRLLTIAPFVFVGACNTLTGIDGYRSCEEPCDASTSDGTIDDVSKDSSDGPSDASAEDGGVLDTLDAACTDPATPSTPGDLVGCPCADAGSRNCAAKGVHVGSPSLCGAGEQSCTSGIFGPCTGATTPEPKEVCWDKVDHDCDGVVGNGCPCSDTADMCHDSTGKLLATGDYVFTDPPTPKIGSKFQVYFVTNKGPITGAFGIKTEKGYCLTSGGFTDRDCKVGSSCSGWYAFHQSIDATSPPFNTPLGAAHSFEVRLDDVSACSSAGRVIAGTVTFVP